MLDNYGFDMWAGGYDADVGISDDKSENPFAGYKKIMNAIYGKVMKNNPASVLDIGIGTGTLTSKLYEDGNDITGIDFSKVMLSKAREKMPNAKLIEYDFTKGLPPELDTVKFDFIIRTYAIHHLTDEEKVRFIKSLLNNIKETGSIIIGDVSFQNREDLVKCKETSGDVWDCDEFYYVFSELEGALKDVCNLSYFQFSHCAGIMEISSISASPD